MQIFCSDKIHFGCELVRAERSDVGVVRALALCDRETFVRLLVFEFFCISREWQFLCIQ